MSIINRLRGNPDQSAQQQPSQPSQPQHSGPPRHLRSGNQVFEEAERNEAEMAKRAEARKAGFVMDFYISMDEAKAGTVKPLIVLDAKLGECGFYEHAIMDGKKFVGTEICVKDWANCPICAKGNHPTFVIKLSVLDITPYKIKSGDREGQVIPFARKMLTIKPRQRAKWREIEQNCIKQNGTFRGCYLEMRRDASDSQSAAIGEPQQIAIEVDIPGRGKQTFFQTFDFITEDKLIENFSTPAKTGTKGEILEEANINLKPFDYLKVFPEPDLSDLVKRFGDTSLGSAESVAREWDTGGSKAPAAPPAADVVRSRLRGSSPAPAAQPAVSPEQEFEQAPQGTLGQGPADAPKLETGKEDDIPFG
jgi:hypothetical protein